MLGVSFARIGAVFLKELIQMRRDRLTFGMIIGIPVLQLVLFGFAINSDPKHLPTAVNVQDPSVYSRTLVRALENSGYFRVTNIVKGEREGAALLASGSVAFVVTVPPEFSRELARGDRPQILIEADASDPAAAANAVAAVAQLPSTVFNRELTGALAPLRSTPPPFEIVVHRRYNPEGISSYNVVPGLIGVILTMTMVLITALAVTREVERGTMENLLAMPLKPFEVMAGKILPYIFMGYIQVTVVLVAARLLFGVPMLGSYFELSIALALFIAANLSIGFTISTIAANQLQAMQMTFFFFLPSILLSGFMFPFRGMPEWAQWIGSILPNTHFMRIVRGVMLKGSHLGDMVADLWPLAAFMLAAMTIALMRYRRTLD
ncbi:MAG: ABC transporter permease [Alphaproteobacteria bacterium]|nr:ABC transporter permease [Alphaproteobacteria bacterium]